MRPAALSAGRFRCTALAFRVYHVPQRRHRAGRLPAFRYFVMPQSFDFELCGLRRRLPFVEVADNLWLASFVCLSDTELVCAAAPELAGRLPPVDFLMTAEAKGIALAAEMSRIMGMKSFIVARKSRKPYMQNAISYSAHSITTQKEQTLWLDGVEAEKIRGKRVALVDDVIATGESLAAIENLAVRAGAQVVARAAILAELGAVARKDIIYLKEHYVFRRNPDGTFRPIHSLDEP